MSKKNKYIQIPFWVLLLLSFTNLLSQQVAVQVDMPGHESVPELTVLYNGHEAKTDDAGFAVFPAPTSLPAKWYFLVSRSWRPIVEAGSSIKTFAINPLKAVLYVARWDNEKESWNIKQKKQESLYKRDGTLKHPEATIIYNIKQSGVSELVEPLVQVALDEQATIMLPRLKLKKEIVTSREVAKSSIYNKTPYQAPLIRATSSYRATVVRQIKA